MAAAPGSESEQSASRLEEAEVALYCFGTKRGAGGTKWSKTLNTEKLKPWARGGRRKRRAEVGGAASRPAPPRRSAAEEVRFGAPPGALRLRRRLARPSGPKFALFWPCRRHSGRLGIRTFRPLERGTAFRRRPWADRPRPPHRERGTACDAGSGPGYALHRAGQPAARMGKRQARRAKPGVCIWCVATHGSLFQTQSECLDGSVKFTGAKYHLTERAGEIAMKRFLPKCPSGWWALNGS